jgi:hypothetical protein
MSKRHEIDLEVRHIALTPEQVDIYNLPHSIDAVKKTDPNYKAWIEAYGPDQAAVELDALHPRIVKEIVERELSTIYDMGSIDEEKTREIEDRRLIREIRCDIDRLLFEKYADLFVEM